MLSVTAGLQSLYPSWAGGGGFRLAASLGIRAQEMVAMQAPHPPPFSQGLLWQVQPLLAPVCLCTGPSPESRPLKQWRKAATCRLAHNSAVTPGDPGLERRTHVSPGTGAPIHFRGTGLSVHWGKRLVDRHVHTISGSKTLHGQQERTFHPC